MTRIEVGIDKRLSELKPGDVVALASDGSGSVVLGEQLGPWDDRMATHGPLTRWSAAWADDAIAGLLPYPVTVHEG